MPRPALSVSLHQEGTQCQARLNTVTVDKEGGSGVDPAGIFRDECSALRDNAFGQKRVLTGRHRLQAVSQNSGRLSLTSGAAKWAAASTPRAKPLPMFNPRAAKCLTIRRVVFNSWAVGSRVPATQSD
jgi:hypothetical protein